MLFYTSKQKNLATISARFFICLKCARKNTKIAKQNNKVAKINYYIKETIFELDEFSMQYYNV